VQQLLPSAPLVIDVTKTLPTPTPLALAPASSLGTQFAGTIKVLQAAAAEGGQRVVRGVGGGPDSVSLSAAVGWLLGYPILYYLPTTEHGNCLGNQPLVLLEFGAADLGRPAPAAGSGSGRGGGSGDGGGNPPALLGRVITSFSIPEALYTGTEDTSLGTDGEGGIVGCNIYRTCTVLVFVFTQSVCARGQRLAHTPAGMKSA
jgi:hypothetical protein